MQLPPWPKYNKDEIEKVKEILLSGKVNYWNGNEGISFEKEFADWCSTKYAICLANGTLALTAAYKAIGISEGDEVITTPRTFIATSSSLVLLKAKPIFADVDKDSGCITAETIEPLITKRTKAISVVHLGGWPANMPSICKLAKLYGISVIEDCSQAHGGAIIVKDKITSIGSFGDVATWSFCLDKIISTGGEGGMVTTNNENIWNYIWSYKDHGKDWHATKEVSHPPGFRWLHNEFGTNNRLTEMQSAIGRIQLKKISETNSLRERNAIIIASYLRNCPLVRIPWPASNFKSAWYKFYCYINPERLKSNWNRDRILSEMQEEGIQSFSGSCGEIYQEKCFINAGLYPEKRLPVAKMLSETSLMFLIHPTISVKIMHKYAQKVCKILKKATN